MSKKKNYEKNARTVVKLKKNIRERGVEGFVRGRDPIRLPTALTHQNMPRRVRFADEIKTVDMGVAHQQPYTDITCDKLHSKPEPEIQQEPWSTMYVNEKNTERRNDRIVDVGTGVMLANQRAQEAMMRARAIQSNVLHQREALHHIVECENRQQLRRNRKQAHAEVLKETDMLSVSMVWISDVFQGIQKLK